MKVTLLAIVMALSIYSIAQPALKCQCPVEKSPNFTQSHERRIMMAEAESEASCCCPRAYKHIEHGDPYSTGWWDYNDPIFAITDQDGSGNDFTVLLDTLDKGGKSHIVIRDKSDWTAILDVIIVPGSMVKTGFIYEFEVERISVGVNTIGDEAICCVDFDMGGPFPLCLMDQVQVGSLRTYDGDSQDFRFYQVQNFEIDARSSITELVVNGSSVTQYYQDDLGMAIAAINSPDTGEVSINPTVARLAQVSGTTEVNVKAETGEIKINTSNIGSASIGDVLTLDAADGTVLFQPAGTGVPTLYSGDGTVAGDRSVDVNNNDLEFINGEDIAILASSSITGVVTSGGNSTTRMNNSGVIIDSATSGSYNSQLRVIPVYARMTQLTGAVEHTVKVDTGGVRILMPGTITSGMFLSAIDATGKCQWSSVGPPGTNIYNADASLTGNRQVTGADYSLRFQDINNFEVSDASGFSMGTSADSVAMGTLVANGDVIAINAVGLVDNTEATVGLDYNSANPNIFIHVRDNSFDQTDIMVSLDSIDVFSGRPNFRGIVYESDYSANYSLRSLVDKGYVDNLYAPIIDTSNPSIAPPNVGRFFINTTTGKCWMSKGTGSTADWLLLN